MNKSLIIGFATALALVFVVLLIPHVLSTNGLAASVGSAGSTNLPTTTVTEQIACARTAVNNRESAIENANTAFEQATNAAYTTRAASFNTAYSQTSWSAVNTSVSATLTAFNTTVTKAQGALKSADALAANNYTTAIATCQE